MLVKVSSKGRQKYDIQNSQKSVQGHNWNEFLGTKLAKSKLGSFSPNPNVPDVPQIYLQIHFPQPEKGETRNQNDAVRFKEGRSIGCQLSFAVNVPLCRERKRETAKQTLIGVSEPHLLKFPRFSFFWHSSKTTSSPPLTRLTLNGTPKSKGKPFPWSLCDFWMDTWIQFRFWLVVRTAMRLVLALI